MTALTNVEILEVKGEKFVDGLVYKDKKTGEEKELKVAGIFVEIGQLPNTEFVKDIVPLDELNRIKIVRSLIFYFFISNNSTSNTKVLPGPIRLPGCA